MLPRTEQPAKRRFLGSRRLNAVRAFVIGAAVLVVAGVVLFCILGRHLWVASVAAQPQPHPPVEKTRTPHPTLPPTQNKMQPLLNEYMYEDRYVVEAVVPGVEPKLHVDYDPLTRRPTLTISWSPLEPSATETGRRYTVQEWQRTGFSRTIPLPEGLSTPEAHLRDGVLTLSFPRHNPIRDNIKPVRVK